MVEKNLKRRAIVIAQAQRNQFVISALKQTSCSIKLVQLMCVNT